MDRVHANSRCHRQQHREGDQDRRQTFHEHAHKDQHEVDQQDNEDAVRGHAQDRGCNLLRDALVGQDECEHVCQTNQDDDGRAGAHVGVNDAGHIRELDLFIDEHAHDQGVNAGHDGSFGGGKDTGKDAAQQDNGHQQRPDSIFGNFQALLPAGTLVLGVVALDRDDVGGYTQCQTQQDTGDDACLEHLANRDAHAGTGNDHGHTGRDDGADHRGSSRNCNREVVVVAVLHHGGDQHTAQRAHVRNGRTGNAGKDHGCYDVHQRKAASEVAQEGVAEVQDAAGDAAAVHQSTSQHEAGDAQQGERVDACIEFLCQDRHVHIGGQQVEQRRSTQRERNGHVQQQQDQKQNKHATDHCALSPFLIRFTSLIASSTT